MLSSIVKTAFAVALLVGGASGAQAKAEKKDVEATRAAERTGAMLFAYDQAAWHGTDKFMTDVASSVPASVRDTLFCPSLAAGCGLSSMRIRMASWSLSGPIASQVVVRCVPCLPNPGFRWMQRVGAW